MKHVRESRTHRSALLLALLALLVMFALAACQEPPATETSTSTPEAGMEAQQTDTTPAPELEDYPGPEATPTLADYPAVEE